MVERQRLGVTDTAEAILDTTAAYARFEARMRRRRIERMTEAARAAIAAGSVHEAAEAIAEIQDLDRDSPELASLTAALERAGARSVAHPQRYGEQRRERGLRGQRGGQTHVRLAAALVGCSIVLVAAPRLERSDRPPVTVPEPPDLRAHPIAAASGTLVARAGPGPAREWMSDEGVPAPVRSQPARPQPARPQPVPAPLVLPPSVLTPPVPMPRVPPQPALQSPGPERASERAPEQPPAPQMASELPRPTATTMSPPVDSAEGPAARASSRAGGRPAGRANDDLSIRQLLGRYQQVFNRLDASAAQTIWPQVNDRALARAFRVLVSQHLNFDSCAVEVLDQKATAACRGTARYVAKVGRRDPRIESGTWQFTLRKRGSDWIIESVRAQR